jgi:hypothetical protein
LEKKCSHIIMNCFWNSKCTVNNRSGWRKLRPLFCILA